MNSSHVTESIKYCICESPSVVMFVRVHLPISLGFIQSWQHHVHLNFIKNMQLNKNKLQVLLYFNNTGLLSVLLLSVFYVLLKKNMKSKQYVLKFYKCQTNNCFCFVLFTSQIQNNKFPQHCLFLIGIFNFHEKLGVFLKLNNIFHPFWLTSLTIRASQLGCFWGHLDVWMSVRL